VLASSEVARLVKRVKRGEIQAFSALVSAHIRAAYMTALAVVGSPDDAEDVVQEAFLVAFERLESCREPNRFSGWLLRIVRNRALNFVSARRVRDLARVAADSTGGQRSEKPTDLGLRGCLLDALTHLTAVQREVVLLHDLEEWTHDEIGDALNLSAVMCRQHLFNRPTHAPRKARGSR
jgi:RNA polymerase sigma-70 factor (ECF subfamily)